MQIYSEHLKNIIKKGVNNTINYDQPLKGFKIIVDAGNGAGGFYANDVLKPLGANIEGSQFLEPNGMFPNHIPNPENKEAMSSASKATINAKADLGIIFDTDVDRGAVVDSDGNEINRNKLVALASAIVLDENSGGTIVTDSITSNGLKDYIENELSGTQHRFKRGYKNVINEAIRLNKEGVNCPAYLVTKIIIKMVNLKKQNKNLKSLIETLKEPLESAEIRIPILKSNFKETGNNVINGLTYFVKNKTGCNIIKNNYEGIRVNFDMILLCH